MTTDHDTEKKRMMLRYAQLIFRKQHVEKANGIPLTPDEESEIASILAAVGLPHEAIIRFVTEGILETM